MSTTTEKTEKQWYDFYKERVGDCYTNYARERYRDFIHVLQQFIPHCGTVVESGCGIGTISKILAHRKSAKYILYDKCPKMVELCQMNIKTNPTVLILQDDITTSLLKPNSDLIFGHGVLEHFTDNDIAKILNLQILLSKYVVHYVPSAKYTSPSFGDERLLSKFTWQLRFKPDHIIEFNDGYDLILIWKGKCS